MRLTDDLSDPRAIFSKGWLFFALGILSAVELLTFAFSWQVALLLSLTVWAFCRWYYFMFYVVEHYVDPGFKFSGLGSFIRYLVGRRSARRR